jgi:hypothetical protein
MRASVIVDKPARRGRQLGVVVLQGLAARRQHAAAHAFVDADDLPEHLRTLQYKLDDVAPVSLAMYTHHVLSVGRRCRTA